MHYFHVQHEQKHTQRRSINRTDHIYQKFKPAFNFHFLIISLKSTLKYSAIQFIHRNFLSRDNLFHQIYGNIFTIDTNHNRKHIWNSKRISRNLTHQKPPHRRRFPVDMHSRIGLIVEPPDRSLRFLNNL